MIGFENTIMAQTVPRAVSMSAAWCADPPSYSAALNSTANVHDQQQQQAMQHYGASAVHTADPSAADLDNFDLSLLLPQPTAAEPTSSADGRVPAVLDILQQQQQDDHHMLNQLTGNYNGPNCYGGADTLDTLDLTQLLSLYDDYCTAEAAGNFQDMLKPSCNPPATATIKEEIDDFAPSPSASPSAFISSSSSPRAACGIPEITYNVNCTWFVKDEPPVEPQPTLADSEGNGKRQSSSVLLRSLLESTVKDEPNDCAGTVATVQSTTDDDGVETKPDLRSADSKASSHKLLIEMLQGPKEERSADDDMTASTAVGSTSPISAAATSSANTAVADLAELLLYSACSSTDQGVPTDNQFDDDKSAVKSSVLQRASHRKWTSSPKQQQWGMVGQQQQWNQSNSPSLDMTVPSLSPQQNGGLNEVDLCAGQALFDDTAALVDGLLFGDGVCRDFKSETSSPASPQDENREDEVRIRAQMDMWKSLLLQQEQQDDDHRQKRNSSTDRSNGQQPPMKRQRIDHEQDTILSTTSLSPLGSFSPASSTSSGGLPLPMLDVNDNIMSIPMSVDCGDKDEEDEYYAGTAATSPSSSTRSPGSSAGSSGTAGSGQPHHHHHIHLWQFLKELLQQHDDHAQPAATADDGGKQPATTIIRWLDRPKGVFKIEDSVAVAKLWGRRKNRPAMNYDKLSRSIRQYYKKGIMKKTERSQRLVYQFCHPYSGGSPTTTAASPGAPVDG